MARLHTDGPGPSPQPPPHHPRHGCKPYRPDHRVARRKRQRHSCPTVRHRNPAQLSMHELRQGTSLGERIVSRSYRRTMILTRVHTSCKCTAHAPPDPDPAGHSDSSRRPVLAAQHSQLCPGACACHKLRGTPLHAHRIRVQRLTPEPMTSFVSRSPVKHGIAEQALRPAFHDAELEARKLEHALDRDA
ncbi:hypothetical protein GY45DRAFT_935923 [Cubamyces sp. BRFM 1775]|nr:hypothetical protein GY45DRAFT_935923 [Cubamyces sp. BRFM 1775]